MKEQGKLVARWHTFYFDSTKDDKGAWVRITETRPNGSRSSILIDQEFADAFQSELLKAVSGLGAPDETHSASAVRPRSYAEWSIEEDSALAFLYKIGNSVADIGHALQRERGAVRSRLGHLGVSL